MARLPLPNSDTDQWGLLLNEFLRVAHREDGTLKATLCASVTEFGALGDARANDTAAFQAALNSGATTICISKGRYLIDTLTVPPRVKRILGDGELIQRSLGPNMLNIAGANGLTIAGLSFTGIAGAVSESFNSAIYVVDSNRVTVKNNTFTQWRHQAVYVQGSIDINISDNMVYTVSGGIRFTGVQRGIIARNILRDPQLPDTTFTVAIGLDSTNGHTYGICRDIVIVDNIVKTYVNAQAILLHAGQRIAVTGNVFDDVLIGISANTFNQTDILNDLTVVGNVYSGTSTPGADIEQGANYGIFAGGGADRTADHITITGNVITNANAVVRSFGQGGIGVGYADHVIIADNVIHDTTGTGIALNNPNTRLLIKNNAISDIATATDGTTSAGIYIVAGTQTGRVSDNRIDGVAWGMRAEVFTPALRIGANDYHNYTLKVVNPANLSFERGQLTIADTNTSGAVTFNAAEADTDYFISATITATSGTPTAGATRIYITDKTTTGFTVHLESAPGVANSVTVDWRLCR